MYIDGKVFQCPACNAVFGEVKVSADEPRYFSKGPRKGQVKEVLTIKKTIKFGDFTGPEYIGKIQNAADTCYSGDAEAQVFACPSCGVLTTGPFPTIKINKI